MKHTKFFSDLKSELGTAPKEVKQSFNNLVQYFSVDQFKDFAPLNSKEDAEKVLSLLNEVLDKAKSSTPWISRKTKNSESFIESMFVHEDSIISCRVHYGNAMDSFMFVANVEIKDDEVTVSVLDKDIDYNRPCNRLVISNNYPAENMKASRSFFDLK